jgi:hypothetical protein
MPTRSARSPVATRNELLDLLNDDFARECRSVFAHAVYAERFRNEHPTTAALIEQRGQQNVRACLILCQLIYDYGGTVTDPIDKLNFVLAADRVADPRWTSETIRRLRQRIAQLRAAGEPGLAKRIRKILSMKRATPGLGTLIPLSG